MGEPDDTLETWEDVKRDADWKGLFIGNGASIAVYSGFNYPSLLSVATDELDPPDRLSDAEAELFSALNAGSNFEQVLYGLATARRIAEVLNPTLPHPLDQTYQHVQEGLLKAVNRTHVEWSSIPDTTLEHIAECLLQYKWVFSVCYDLLVYWAFIRKKEQFTDWFAYEQEFEPELATAKTYQERTRILYLHGALHLYQLVDGIVSASPTKKLTTGDGGNLLEQFAHRLKDPRYRPIFVSEGESDQKLAAIQDNEYLRCVFDYFERFDQPLVVFGSRLGVEGHEKWLSLFLGGAENRVSVVQ